MLHFVKSDIASVGPGAQYMVGESESFIGGEVRVKKGKRDGLPVVRKTMYRGIPINIQFDVGMKASGKDDDGTPWEVTYIHPYGEIPNTEERDGDPVDIYLGMHDSDLVFVVHQVTKDGRFDEDKVFLGFKDGIEATECYFQHGPRWGFGSLETLTFDQFRNGYLVGKREDASAHEPLIVHSGSDF